MGDKILGKKVKELGWLGQQQNNFIPELLVAKMAAIVFLFGDGQTELMD